MAAFVDELLDSFHERTPIRAGSLIVTVFGDAVVPRGGVLSLGSLHEIMRAFRISDTLVRTALSRLVSDGWFTRWKLGRNSHYRLTSQGEAAFARATQRIYADPPQGWNDAFDLVLIENTQERACLRAELVEAGYGSLGPDLVIAPSVLFAKEGPFLRLSATPPDRATARRLVELAWPIQDIETRYQRFLATYSGTLDALEQGERVTDLEALLVRILLIHDFRRAVLKDPLLPRQLLPSPWAGAAARELCGSIYKTLVPAAERWITAHGRDDKGALPSADRIFMTRFACARPLQEQEAP